MSVDVISEIRQFLGEKRLMRRAVENDDASLLDAGVIDSLAIVELTAFLEQEFGIRVDEDDLVPENFDSFRAMDAFVKSKQAKPESADK